MISARQQRVLRAAAAATLATVVALLSHLAAGGALPALAGLALPWALSLAVCTVLSGRDLSLARLSVAVGAAQTLFHVLFVVGVVPPASAAAATVSGHHHGYMPSSESGSSAAAPAGAALAHLDGGMLFAHVLAAVATVAALHRGERLLRALVALAGRVRARLRLWAGTVAPPVSPLRMPAPAASGFIARLHPLVASPARRGPPLLPAL